MAVHWQIKFRSLRANTLYTVNIYDEDYSGSTPVQLTGASEPITIEEDDNDNFFASIRTQSGYLRIIDDGSFNWRDLIPTTDVDRPVTLTHTSGGSTIVDWQGFIQAQNFQGKLYDTPQERELPLQCALAVLNRLDVNPTEYNGIRNFAQLLQYAMENTPTLSFTNYVIQGGADARSWLLKKFDWALFGELDEDDVLHGKYNIYTALSNMCRYWGWTIRTMGQTVYLMAPDDTQLVNFLLLTSSQLSDLADEDTSAGTIQTGGLSTLTITDAFASDNNRDTQLRGYNTAVLTSEVGELKHDIVYGFPDIVNKTMYDGGFIAVTTYIAYTEDITSFDTHTIHGECENASDASFNIIRWHGPDPITFLPIIEIKTLYQASVLALMRSKIPHAFAGCELTLKGKAYFGNKEIDAHNEGFTFGYKHIMMQIGIGTSLQNAVWWNGEEWVQGQTSCYAKIGGTDGVLWTCKSKTVQDTAYVHKSIDISGKYGYLYIHFMGADEEVYETYYNFNLVDFAAEVSIPEDPWRFIDPDRKKEKEYKAKNDSVVKKEWSDSVIFSTENYSKYGMGLVLNDVNSYFSGWNYETHQAGSTPPEQHMVDRVVAFWNKSRRSIKCYLRSDAISDATPKYKITIDNSTMYPIAINHDWYNDITYYHLIEL